MKLTKLKPAISLALSILEEFADTKMYQDYREIEGFTNTEYDEMIDVLRRFNKELSVDVVEEE